MVVTSTYLNGIYIFFLMLWFYFLTWFSSRHKGLCALSFTWGTSSWLPPWIGYDRSDVMEIPRPGHKRQYSFCPLFGTFTVGTLPPRYQNAPAAWRGTRLEALRFLAKLPGWWLVPTGQPCECAILETDPLGFSRAAPVDTMGTRPFSVKPCSNCRFVAK